MSYERDILTTIEGSASISSMITTRLAPYITSASVSAALSPYYTSLSASAALAALRPPSLILLGTLTTTSGTTQSLTGIGSSYRRLYMELDGVSFTGVATLALAVGITTTYGTPVAVADPTTAGGDVINGLIRLENFKTTSVGCISNPITYMNASRYQINLNPQGSAGASGPYDAIQFSGGTFDAGTIRIYGIAA